MEDLISHINQKYDLQISATSRVSGGDINDAFRLETNKGSFFMKSNRIGYALDMFETEAKGIELLRSSGAIRCPEVIGYSIIGKTAFLILKWIESSRPVSNFWQLFGSQLAKLHKTVNSHFGLDHDNYIGRLNQKNSFYEDFASFYAEMRLIPQFRMAFDQGYFNSNHSTLFAQLISNLNKLIPAENPGLIHGDLWSGNFMTDAKGLPCIIDPSVHYGHRESDIAMSKLFGGFPAEFYNCYNEVFPLHGDWKSRIELFQLYYLLVHVNLFGSSYVSSCVSIMRKYQ